MLWGDLEEHKARSIQHAGGTDIRRPGDRPALDSDSEEDSEEDSKEREENSVSNMPFTGCIKQYGVQVDEDDPAKADAGRGKRWERGVRPVRDQDIMRELREGANTLGLLLLAA